MNEKPTSFDWKAQANVNPVCSLREFNQLSISNHMLPIQASHLTRLMQSPIGSLIITPAEMYPIQGASGIQVRVCIPADTLLQRLQNLPEDTERAFALGEMAYVLDQEAGQATQQVMFAMTPILRRQSQIDEPATQSDKRTELQDQQNELVLQTMVMICRIDVISYMHQRLQEIFGDRYTSSDADAILSLEAKILASNWAQVAEELKPFADRMQLPPN